MKLLSDINWSCEDRRRAAMKGFAVLFFLAPFGFLAEARLEGIRPLNVVMSVNSTHTVDEWRTIMKAQKSRPIHFPELKNGTKPQTDFAGKVHVPDAGRITNGYTASRSQFPWQVYLIIDNAYFCGGSLISDEWVLTAAHCTSNFASFDVTLGANRVDNTESDSKSLASRTSVVHSGYSQSTIDNDIALIRLPQPVDFTLYIIPVRLPTRSQANTTFVNEKVQSSGWGKISDPSEEISSTLQYVDLSVITNNLCATTFGSMITDTKICVSTTDFKSPCNGDSGGPLVFQEDDGRYTEIGIVSFGHIYGCEFGYPVAFTRVTSYLDWIENNTDILIH